jgi:hypothetical protein
MLTNWKFYKHAGEPTGKQSGTTFSISAGVNDQGTYYNVWDSDVVPGQRYRYDGAESGSKPTTLLVFFDGTRFVESVKARGGQVIIVPDGVNKMRLDLRNWGGGGTAVWQNPQVAFVGEAPEPEPPVEPPTEPDEPEPPAPDPDPEPQPPTPEPEPEPTPEPDGPVYFVAADGNDSVPKGENSIERPWKTLHLAVARLDAGDTLYIRGGDYVLPANGEMVIDKPGVTVAAYRFEQVVIDGRAEWDTTERPNPTDNTLGYDIARNPVGTGQFQALIEVTADDVTVRGLTLRNSAGEGLRVTGGKRARIEWMRFEYTHGPGMQLYTGADYGTAVECVSYKASRKGSSHALGARFCEYVRFERCTASHYLGEGMAFARCNNSIMKDCITFNGAKVGFYNGVGKGNTFDGCIAYATAANEHPRGKIQVGMKITAEVDAGFGENITEDVTVKNCLIVGHSPNFLIAGGTDGVRFPDGSFGQKVNPDWGMRGLRIFNNTFVDAAPTDSQDYNVGIYNKTFQNNKRNTQCWFVNNLIVQRDDMPALNLNGFTDYSKWHVGGNVWSKNVSGRFKGDTDTVSADVRLAHAAKVVLERTGDFDLYDYLITAGSAAIGAGTNAFADASGVAVDTDYFGAARGDQPDAGFHQFNAPQPDPDEPQPEPEPTPEPEPPAPQPVQITASGYQLGSTMVLMIPAPAGYTAPPFGQPLTVVGEWVGGELRLTIEQWGQEG